MLQLLLPQHGGDCVVHSQHLVVARHDLARAARAAVVEQNKVLGQVEQALLRQYPVQECLCIQPALFLLVVAFPLDKVLPLAGDRAVASAVAVAHHQERIVVEGMRDAVLVQVIGEVIVEAGADVAVHGLQFDKHQRQAIDEADEVGAPVVVRHAHALHLQFAHCEKAIVNLVPEIDCPCQRMPRLALRIAPVDRHPAADETVELAIVLHQRAGEVGVRELLDGLLARRFGQIGIETGQRRAQVAHQHRLALVRATERAIRTEGLGVVGVDAVPA